MECLKFELHVRCEWVLEWPSTYLLLFHGQECDCCDGFGRDSKRDQQACPDAETWPQRTSIISTNQQNDERRKPRKLVELQVAFK